MRLDWLGGGRLAKFDLHSLRRKLISVVNGLTDLLSGTGLASVEWRCVVYK